MNNLQDNIKVSRATRLVPSDKFDRHMKRARVRDIESRKVAFCANTESTQQRKERNKNIKTSVY